LSTVKGESSSRQLSGGKIGYSKPKQPDSFSPLHNVKQGEHK